LPFGHPRSPFEPFEGVAVPDDQCALVRLAMATPTKTKVRPGGQAYVCIAVENCTNAVIGESLSTPIRLASWWLDESGQRLAGEPERSVQAWRATPGSTAHLVGRAKAPSVPGCYSLVFGLVQEAVRWFDHPTGTQVAGHWTVG
jgi:hypothetical protein